MIRIRTRIAVAAGAVALGGGLLFAPSALAADPQCTDLHGAKVDCSVDTNRVVVDTADGVLAGVKVGDTLCLRVEALSQHETADVKLRIPCEHPIKTCAEAAKFGYHDVSSTDPRYRRYLDADHDGIACETPPVVVPVPVPVPAEAPPATTVQYHLPVTH